MKMMLLAAIILVAWIGTAFCGETPAPQKTIGINPAYRNLSVKPGDDFDEYANGGWRKTAEIPADRSSIGAGFEVFERAEKRTADLVRETAASTPQPDTPQGMIATYYAAFMDTANIEKRGLNPLKEKLREIDAITTKADLARVLGQRLRADVDPLNATAMWTENLFGVWVTQALSEPERTVPYLLQGGLGMPDREYYVSDKPEMATLRTTYQKYIADLLRLAGMSDAVERAERITALEKKMAAVHADIVTSENVHKANNPATIADLKSKAPGLDWDAYLSAAGLDKQPLFIIWQPDAIKGLSALVGSESLDTWKEWLAFHTISRYAAFLPQAYDDLRFSFYNKTLQGTPKQLDRWKRAIANVNADLGDAVGKIYVAKYFPPSSKAEVQEMVNNLRAAFEHRIDALNWMAPATKEQAKAKLKTLRVGVGYPDKWRDYAGLVIRRDDAWGNAWRASEWEYHHQLAKLGRPVDRDEWWMTPQTVNALNLPLQNGLNFPAAILDAPFFDSKADAAANYGSMGATIGHEISHSFDNSGAEFNAQGKLANWWTSEDAAHFKAASQQLVEQFNQYEPLPGLHVNGQQTLGENIADVAGLSAAYDAYKLALHGKELPVVDGLTGDQRFFLSFAQGWRQKIRDAALRSQIVTNEHAPSRERAQTVRNIDAWYEAYAVKPLEKLYLKPEERVHIW
ncbi:MAG: M13 family metallopeptidase [Alphaproteobacteria bacterium]|nr:MAG: M13 family metallopeptidase [Alphaproteobacteria bacterium]